jgi:hypothetical protein
VFDVINEKQSSNNELIDTDDDWLDL